MNSPSKHDPRIIVALDYPRAEPALDLLARLSPDQCRIKIGKELFTRSGPALIDRIHAAGFEVFLDLKFHDIPNTVAGACAAAADLGVWMVNVHASGGRRMLEAARTAIDKAGHQPLLIAVTVLTSMQDQDLLEVGVHAGPAEQVQRLAALAEQSGCDGVVCSPLEVVQLREQRRPGFLLVTPGIRPADALADDQRRVTTPAMAIRQGASYLVIGRPITAAPDPMQALLTMESEISALPM